MKFSVRKNEVLTKMVTERILRIRKRYLIFLRHNEVGGLEKLNLHGAY